MPIVAGLLIIVFSAGCATTATDTPDGWTTCDSVRVQACSDGIESWLSEPIHSVDDAVIIAAMQYICESYRASGNINSDKSTRILASVLTVNKWLLINGYQDDIIQLIRQRIKIDALDIRDSEILIGLLKAGLQKGDINLQKGDINLQKGDIKKDN